MTWIAAIALAAICNSVMDSLYEVHIKATVFGKLNQRFWCKEISTANAKFLPFTHYRVDAWHIHKSVMIIFMCVAALCYHFYPIWRSGIWWVDLLIMGAAWDVTFNTFYNHLLKRKK